MNHASNSQKGFTSIILILFILVVAGVAGYLYLGKNLPEISLPTPKSLVTPTPNAVATPTPDPTADWKTYIDQQHTFSFKYPPNLVPRPLIQDDESEIISFAFDDKEKLVLAKLPNLQNMDLREFNEKIKLTDTKIEYESSLVNGYKALFMRTKWPCINECDPAQVKNEQYHVEFKGNKMVVGFKINTLDKVGGTSISDEKWLDQILSTFKFLDQTSPEGKFCGGIAANLPENKCPEGYTCKLDGNFPDSGGKCIKK